MSRYSDDALVLTLVRQAGEVLAGLGLPGRFTFDELHERVERHRGRPIDVRPHPMPAEGPHGLWVMGQSSDYVFVDASAPPLRRIQIIGHEFGHMLFDDRGAPLPGAPALRGCT